jgi:hypothetical protein
MKTHKAGRKEIAAANQSLPSRYAMTPLFLIPGHQCNPWSKILLIWQILPSVVAWALKAGGAIYKNGKQEGPYQKWHSDVAARYRFSIRSTPRFSSFQPSARANSRLIAKSLFRNDTLSRCGRGENRRKRTPSSATFSADSASPRFSSSMNPFHLRFDPRGITENQMKPQSRSLMICFGFFPRMCR